MPLGRAEVVGPQPQIRMRIKLLTYHKGHSIGEIVNLPKSVALKLVKLGKAIITKDITKKDTRIK